MDKAFILSSETKHLCVKNLRHILFITDENHRHAHAHSKQFEDELVGLLVHLVHELVGLLAHLPIAQFLALI